MGQPYVGEIRMFGGNFAPAGWAFCDGSLVAIADNDVLFNLIGTTYGGDGQNTFALPDLRGRLPVHQGGGHVMSEASGVEEVTLTLNQIPGHTHSQLAAATSATSSSPVGALPAGLTSDAAYSGGGIPDVQMGVTSTAGGSQPHNNLMPYLCVNFIISLYGVYPSAT